MIDHSFQVLAIFELMPFKHKSPKIIFFVKLTTSTLGMSIKKSTWFKLSWCNITIVGSKHPFSLPRVNKWKSKEVCCNMFNWTPAFYLISIANGETASSQCRLTMWVCLQSKAKEWTFNDLILKIIIYSLFTMDSYFVEKYVFSISTIFVQINYCIFWKKIYCYLSILLRNER